jgi:hypothetical protein
VKDSSCSLQVFSQGLQRGSLHHALFAPAVRHVEELAANGNDPAAMVLVAEKYRMDGALSKALRFAEAAQDKAVGLQTALPKAPWYVIARVKQAMKDEVGEQIAVEHGAFKDDDPDAYLYLAKNFTRGDQDRCMQYALKAAASGNLDAAVEVGRGYLAQAEAARSGEASRFNFALAEEWFLVAASAEEQSHVKLHVPRRIIDLFILACAAARSDFAAGQRRLLDRFDPADDKWAERALRKFGEAVEGKADGATLLQDIKDELDRTPQYRQMLISRKAPL